MERREKMGRLRRAHTLPALFLRNENEPPPRKAFPGGRALRGIVFFQAGSARSSLCLMVLPSRSNWRR